MRGRNVLLPRSSGASTRCFRSSARSRSPTCSAVRWASPCMACRRSGSCAKGCGWRAALAGRASARRRWQLRAWWFPTLPGRHRQLRAHRKQNRAPRSSHRRRGIVPRPFLPRSPHRRVPRRAAAGRHRGTVPRAGRFRFGGSPGIAPALAHPSAHRGPHAPCRDPATPPGRRVDGQRTWTRRRARETTRCARRARPARARRQGPDRLERTHDPRPCGRRPPAVGARLDRCRARRSSCAWIPRRRRAS